MTSVTLPSMTIPRRLLLVPMVLLALSGCSIFKGDGEPETPTSRNRTPILSRIATEIVADPQLVGTAVVLPTPQANTAWAQAGGNAAKVPGHLTLGAAPTQAWSVKIGGSTSTRRLAASPVVADGKLFVVDSAAIVYAFDSATGARLWQHEIAVTRDLQNATFGGGASFDNGRVYATNGVGDVVALDAATGNEIWRVKPSGPLRGSPTVAFNQVFVMTQDNQIFALSATDGSIVWQDAGASGQAGLFGVAAPAAGQGTVVAGYSSGELVAYRYENGRNLWSDALSRTSISTQVGTHCWQHQPSPSGCIAGSGGWQAVCGRFQRGGVRL